MKKLLTACGTIVLALIALGLIGYVAFFYQARRLEKEGKEYVDRAIPLIVRNWDYDALIARAAPELSRVVPPEKLALLFQMFAARLGAFKRYNGSDGSAMLSFIGGQGMVGIGEYVAQAEFEKESAELNLRVVKRKGRWQILNFQVNSDAFLHEPELAQ